MKKRVIIIGAGIGGLSAGARLLKKGYDVIIIEKNSKCGGKTGVIKEAGFTFDLTASILMMPQEYKNILDELGLKLDFIKLDPNYRVYYADQKITDYYTDLPKTLQEIGKINPHDERGYLKFLSNTYKKYEIAYQTFLNRNFDSKDDIFNNHVIKSLIQVNPITHSYHYISKYIKDEKVRNFLAFQTMYIGVNPFKSSNMYTLIPMISAVKGLWYLKGGMHSFINILENYIREHGGTIELNTICEKFLLDKSNIKGIKTNRGSIYGDVIVCNSDYTYSMKTFYQTNLADIKSINRTYNYSCSVFMAYLGLKKKYPSLGVHNIYIGPHFKKNIQQAFKGKIPSEPSFYLYCPTKIDSTMAPKGKEAINVMIRVPNTLDKKIEWNETDIRQMRGRLIRSLQSLKDLNDIKENIEFEKYLTPKDLEQTFNCSYGNAFGISHNLTQTSFFRPQIKSRELDNLYFIGDSVHPGTGVSLVLLGSKLLCEYL
ncbi:phytoene desaturase family protein [Anaerovorax sp. IOR16]|uniref:phytoene desaturase family protein n=1 Tax=Anaerovorax sp. IOR16 TaxID=2773458 RepID=UPI0019D0018D|nr:phytoene desaturase family protein [Anaerovorax sp. IOR16]